MSNNPYIYNYYSKRTIAFNLKGGCWSKGAFKKLSSTSPLTSSIIPIPTLEMVLLIFISEATSCLQLRYKYNKITKDFKTLLKKKGNFFRVYFKKDINTNIINKNKSEGIYSKSKFISNIVFLWFNKSSFLFNINILF